MVVLVPKQPKKQNECKALAGVLDFRVKIAGVASTLIRYRYIQSYRIVSG